MRSTDPKDALAALWRHAGQPADALDAVELTGSEPALPSSFAVGTAAQASVAAAALAAAGLWRLRSGRPQGGKVGMSDAASEVRSERDTRASGGAAALGAAGLWRLRSGRPQWVKVAMSDAAIEFRSERYMRVDGEPPKELWDKIAGLYRCGDGRWVRLHTNFPHHRDGMLKLVCS